MISLINNKRFQQQQNNIIQITKFVLNQYKSRNQRSLQNDINKTTRLFICLIATRLRPQFTFIMNSW